MKKIKKLSKSQIDSMSETQRKEYYKKAVEHYGNLKKQLHISLSKLEMLLPHLFTVTRYFLFGTR